MSDTRPCAACLQQPIGLDGVLCDACRAQLLGGRSDERPGLVRPEGQPTTTRRAETRGGSGHGLGPRPSAATYDATVAVGPVYLAGPITPTERRTLDQNVHQAVRTLRYLTARRVAAVCPQLSALRPELLALPDAPVAVGGPTYEDWMQVDFVLLATCKAVLALPGWDTSRGARRELLFAGDRGVPVFYDIPRLFAHFGVEARCARMRPASRVPQQAAIA